jgi:predicted permease
MIGELRQAMRTLGRTPAYTLNVLAMLALGVGATTAVFGLVTGVVLKPLPFPDAERLVLVRQRNPQAEWNTSVVDFRAIQERTVSFDGVAAMRRFDVLMTGSAEAQWVEARAATADYFRVMGILPAHGRSFDPGDDRSGAERVVVIGSAFAERRFGSGVDPLGQSLTLDGHPHTIVGVMPTGAESLPAMSAEIWPVLQLAEPTRRGPFMLSTLARMKPGVTYTQAMNELAAVSDALFPEWQAGFQDESALLAPRSLHEVITGDAGRYLWTAFAAAAAVLLIALVNVANLVLMRVAERAQELGIRAALGATRWRMVRLLIAEAFVLAAVGGALGVGLAQFMLDFYGSLGAAVPRLSEVSIDRQVLAFAIGMAALSGVIVSTVPLLFRNFGTPGGAARRAMGASAGRRQRWCQNSLVALEFALALPLLVASLLLFHSLTGLQRVDPGFDARHLLTARVQLQESTYPDRESRQAFWARALSELRAIPGVLSVGLAGVLPPQCGCYNNFEIVGRTTGEGSQPQSPWVPVSDGYFGALGIPLAEGRVFDGRDVPDSQPVLVVTESWARRHFPGQPAVGRELYEGGDRSRAFTIVGVVGDVRFDGLESPGEAVFAPMSQGWANNPAYLHLRTALDSSTVVAPLRATLRRLDPGLVPTEVTTMGSRLRDAIGMQRHWTAVLTGFALAAILLSALGVFAVLAFYVARQHREIGIRMALGADRHRVTSMLIRRGVGAATTGSILGVAAAVLVMAHIEPLLFEVSRTDPRALATAFAVLMLLAASAAWLPARRAARIDPIQALREE